MIPSQKYAISQKLHGQYIKSSAVAYLKILFINSQLTLKKHSQKVLNWTFKFFLKSSAIGPQKIVLKRPL